MEQVVRGTVDQPAPAILLAAPGLVCRRGFGPTEHVLGLARALARTNKRRPDVLFARLEDDVAEEGLRLLDLGKRGGVGRSDSLTLGVNPLEYGRHVAEVRRFCRHALPYDLIIERMWGLGGVLGVRLAARAGGRGALAAGGSPGREAARHAPVLIFEENGPLRWRRNLLRPADALRRLYFHAARARLRRVYRQAGRIVVQTEGLARRLIREFGVPGGLLEVIPNGVDPLGGIARERPGAEAADDRSVRAPRKLVYAGSLDAAHDLRPLLQAVVQARHQDVEVELHLFGAGDEEPALRRLVRDAPGVLWHGRMSRDLLADQFERMDLGVAPYGGDLFEAGSFEFAPLKVLEYMAAGLPVATMPGGPDGGLIESGRNGYLLANTCEAWLELLAMLPRSCVLRLMGRDNPARVASRTWDAVAGRYLELYREARSQGGPQGS